MQKIKFIAGIVFVLISNILYAECRIEKFTFISRDSVAVKGELWIPQVKPNNKIIIFVDPSAEFSLLSENDTYMSRRKIKTASFESQLRTRLLASGCMLFDFSAKKDSVTLSGIRVPGCSMYTKAQDLDAAIRYIKTRRELKHKQLIVLGTSEGGCSCAISASKNKDITGIVFFASPCVSGKQIVDYQGRQSDTLLISTFGRHTIFFETINKHSSLKKAPYEPNINGLRKYREEMFGPLDQIVQQYDNYDTIVNNVVMYMKERWGREDSITRYKIYKNRYPEYCQSLKYREYITPWKIAIRKWRPELYYPGIKCPVLTVNGTKDARVEWFSTIANMKTYLHAGGNDNLTIELLNGCDHYFRSKREILNDEYVIRVMNWILKL